jgi:hypothetical protein
MDYEYTMSGGLRVAGCTHVTLSVFRHFKYSPGSLVYACFEAQKGILEEVMIKKIKLLKNRHTYNRIVPLYVDRNNAVYMEEELCTQAEAVAEATAFYEHQLVLANQLLASCPSGG